MGKSTVLWQRRLKEFINFHRCHIQQHSQVSNNQVFTENKYEMNFDPLLHIVKLIITTKFNFGRIALVITDFTGDRIVTLVAEMCCDDNDVSYRWLVFCLTSLSHLSFKDSSFPVRFHQLSCLLRPSLI